MLSKESAEHQSSHNRLGSQKQERKEVQLYPLSWTINHLLKVHPNSSALRKRQSEIDIEVSILNELEPDPTTDPFHRELVCHCVIIPSSLNLRNVSSKIFIAIVHLCRNILLCQNFSPLKYSSKSHGWLYIGFLISYCNFIHFKINFINFMGNTGQQSAGECHALQPK